MKNIAQIIYQKITQIYHIKGLKQLLLNRLSAFFLVSLIFNLASCSLPSRPEPEIVTSLRFSPPAFDPFVQIARVDYSLKRPATISLYITDEDNKVVKTIIEDVKETSGTHSHAWLGGNDGNRFVPVGSYYGLLRTEDGDHTTTVEVFHY